MISFSLFLTICPSLYLSLCFPIFHYFYPFSTIHFLFRSIYILQSFPHSLNFYILSPSIFQTNIILSITRFIFQHWLFFHLSLSPLDLQGHSQRPGGNQFRRYLLHLLCLLEGLPRHLPQDSTDSQGLFNGRLLPGFGVWAERGGEAAIGTRPRTRTTATNNQHGRTSLIACSLHVRFW